MPRARAGGSWVSDPIDVFDGEKRIYIYKRPNTAKWQVFISTETEGSIRQSLGTDDQDKAIELARERWYEIQGRQRSGLKVKREKKLFDFIDEYLEEEEKRISNKPREGITEGTFRGKRVHLYWLKEFFNQRNIKLEQINRKSLYKYGVWRQKDSKTPPKTNHTINAEISTIKGFFTFLYRNGWIDIVPPMDTVKTEAPEDLRRDYMTLEEWKRTIPTLVAWKKDKDATARQLYNRRVLYCAILVMINSSLRKGELKQLKWKDIVHNPQLSKDDPNKDVHHLINIRAETTKTGKPRVVNTPTQEWFEELRKICGIEKAGRHFPYIPIPHREDYIFCKEGKPDLPLGVGTWNRCWKEIKDRIYDAGGTWIKEKNISWYSFRHSSISFAVLRGVNHLKLARNAGTGLKYVEHFYYHHESSLSTEELSKGRTFFNKKKDLLEPILDDSIV